LSGILVSETATSIALMGPEAKQETVLRADIVQLQTTGQSLMPEGLQQGLTPQQMADLIAWVLSAGKGK
ncbi:MAG: c-type cytochrome, partial [Planctomycetota bacterium]|nr:c-type cytochrome [Planctomycetota bacterium]